VFIGNLAILPQFELRLFHVRKFLMPKSPLIVVAVVLAVVGWLLADERPRPKPDEPIMMSAPPNTPTILAEDANTEKIRMPSLPTVLGRTPTPTKEDLNQLNVTSRCLEPRMTIDIIEGRSRLTLLKTNPSEIQLADESILGHNVLSPKQWVLQGRKVGITTITLWFPDPTDSTRDEILT